MEVFEKVSAYITKHRLVKPGETLVVGVSGGADSLCLLDCLAHWGANPVVAHLDHQLRQDSSGDAEYVRQVALSYGYPFELDAVELGAQKGGSLEERARLARYSFLAAVAHKYGVKRLVVGHTFDDQVETILMHFLRGAGAAGLRGMLPETHMVEWAGVPGSEQLTIIRPLLAVRHAETVDYCAHVGLEPRFDRSNLDRTYFRNKVRLDLLPVLEQYNPGIRPVIYRLGEIMRAEVEYVREQVDRWWPEATQLTHEGGIVLRADRFNGLPLAIQRGIARRMIEELRPELRDVGFDHVEQVVDFMQDPERTASKPVVGDLLIINYGEDAFLVTAGSQPLAPDFPQIEADIIIDSFNSCEIELSAGWSLSISQIENADPVGLLEKAKDAWAVFVDPEHLSADLVLRSRHPGDRIQPLGMQGTAKVSDLMINKKIPQLARERWPLLVSNDEIVWIPGIHLSHPYRVTKKTRRVLRCSVSAPGRIPTLD